MLSLDLVPQINLTGKLTNKSHSENRFYAGVLPSCKGLSDPQWNYQLHGKFRLNADSSDKYILEILHEETETTKEQVKVYKAFDICYKKSKTFCR